MKELFQTIADNARHRYDSLDDSEIIAYTLMDLNDVLQATQGSYKTQTLSNLLNMIWAFIVAKSKKKSPNNQCQRSCNTIMM